MAGYPSDFKMISRDKIMTSLYEYPLKNVDQRIGAFISNVAREQGLLVKTNSIHSTYYRGKFWYDIPRINETDILVLNARPELHTQIELTGMAPTQMAKLIDEREFVLDEQETLHYFMTMTMNAVVTLTDLYKILPKTVYEYIPYKVDIPDVTISKDFIDEFKHKHADIICIIKERLSMNLLLKGTDYT